MKALIVSLQVAPGASKGHLHPMLGVAAALIDEGHEVGWLALPAPLHRAERVDVEARGATVLPTPPAAARSLLRGAALAAVALDPDRCWEVYRGFLVDPVGEALDDVVAGIERFAPEAAAIDAMSYVAIIAAHRLGLPFASVCAGLKMASTRSLDEVYRGEMRPLVDARAELFADHGLAPELRLTECLSPWANVMFSTEALLGPVDGVELVGPSLRPPAVDEVEAFPWERLASDRPLVLASFGSVHRRVELPDVVDPLLDACAEIGAQAVVASETATERAGAIVRPWVPQRALLARADAFVTHGGASSVAESLARGIAPIVVPLSGDQGLQAELVVAAGAGEHVPRADAERCLRAALERSLAPEAPARAAAAAIATSFAARDGAREAARIVAGLASVTGKTQSATDSDRAARNPSNPRNPRFHSSSCRENETANFADDADCLRSAPSRCICGGFVTGNVSHRERGTKIESPRHAHRGPGGPPHCIVAHGAAGTKIESPRPDAPELPGASGAGCSALRASGALAAWRSALGAAAVVTDVDALTRATANVTALARRILAVLRPRSADEVAAVVAIAARHRVPLHPISRGCNWGLGSRLPTRDGVAIVDLGALDRILSVDTVHGRAVIEPGVTQAALAAHLQALGAPFFLDVTGSAAGSSVIGNALDRGNAYHGPRADTLLAIEAVIGRGEHVTTGPDPTSRVAHLHRPALGPDLDGLLVQGDLAIVTRATVRLRPRREAHALVTTSIDRSERLGALVDAARRLAQASSAFTAFHIGNRARAASVLGPGVLAALLRRGHADGPALRRRVDGVVAREARAAWTLVTPVSGSTAEVSLFARSAGRAFAGIGRVTVATEAAAQRRRRWLGLLAAVSTRAEDRLAVAEAAAPSMAHAVGVPSDTALPSVAWSLDRSLVLDPDLDAGRAGTLFVVPAVPFRGADVVEAVDLVERVLAPAGFPVLVTWNSLGDATLEGVINLVFDRRDPDAVTHAHATARTLRRALADRGFPPHRLGVQDAGDAGDAVSPRGRTLARIAAALDPDGALAPGRYALV